jgi:hypothetical protein
VQAKDLMSHSNQMERRLILMNALTENISRLDRRVGGSPTLDAALGPLGDLVNGATWIGDATGWNLMVVPSPQDPKNPFLVMVSKLFETHFV